jgi:FkbM family methyltransferase
VIFDIGANIGLYSLLASDILESHGKVYAFEPSSTTFKALTKNLSLNNVQNVSAFQFALSNENGIAHLAPNLNSDEKDAYNYIDLVNSDAQGEQIEIRTLDSFVEEYNIKKLDFIKIDVEGAELLCLKGAAITLNTLKPTIIFESYEPFAERFNYSVADLVTYLKEMNYNLYQFEDYQWVAYSSKKGIKL